MTPDPTGHGEKAPEQPPRRSGDSLLHLLLELQSEFIAGSDPRPLLERLLTLLLEETGSEQGFLGVELEEPGAASSCQLIASEPPGWMDATWELSTWRSPRDPEPRSLHALVDRALATGQPLSAEGPAALSDRAPLPADSPSLRSFLALPLRAGDTRIGLVGLGGHLGGGARRMDHLQPLLSVCRALLQGWRDTRRRAQAEEESRHLRAELERLRQIFASVEDALWSCNLFTRELHSSRRFLEIVGYTQDELEPTLDAWNRLCHPEDLPRIERSLREHVEGATPLAEFEYRARCKDGTWAWILCRARVATRDKWGQPVCLVGSDTDLTATKRGEERLSALLQAIPDLIFRLRSDGTFIDFSCSTAEATLLTPGAFIGRNIRDLPLPRQVIDLTLCNMKRVIREGTVAVYEYELDMPQGRQSYEARTVRSGPDEIVSIVRNITERRLVEERQAQLIQTEKLASLGQLAAGIAHEINNPVSYVASNLKSLGHYVSTLDPLLRELRELLEAPAPEAHGRPADRLSRLRQLWKEGRLEELLADIPELLQESLKGTQCIKEIVQSLRVFAREDEGKPQVVDLNAELESTLRMVWNELKYKCTVRRDYGPLPPVTCHPTQLIQVFTNLLVNAGQSIETWGEIRVRTRQEGHEVRVEITDTGKGMTPETISRIFTPFFTTKPRGQGTGLGLSISHDIVTRHGGRIEVQSEPGKGSTFTILLPITPPR